MRKLLLLLLCVPLIFSCRKNHTIKQLNTGKFEQVGHYRSSSEEKEPGSDRCFAYTYAKDDEEEILQHAKERVSDYNHQMGRNFKVFYFNNYNAKDISFCNSFLEATELCLDLNWEYEFSISPNNKENFRKNE